jgi:hypothetical protein
MEHKIIHSAGSIFGSILIYKGIINKSAVYLVSGILWAVTNYIFLSGGENVFSPITANKNKLIFSILFMAIPAYIMGYLVFKETYKYNDSILRLAILLVIIVDTIHLYQMYPVTVAIILVLLFIIRRNNPIHYDDLHPLIPIDRDLLDRADYLFVIPKYRGEDLTKFPKYVEWLKEYSKKNNKILAMHGVTHSPESYFSVAEFGEDKSENYIGDGMEIFKNAFGYYPKFFKAPCYNLSNSNREKIEKLGMKVFGVETLIFNKLFHPNKDIFLKIFNIGSKFF